MSARTLNTTLPSDTLYVSGTVNGVAATWTNTEGQTWETVAERSETDIYVVALTIINSLGTTTETQFTLYYGLHLITDRTKEDVTYVQNLAKKITAGTATEEDLAEWNRAELKGSYNYTDLNRVGSAMRYVADRLTKFGYLIEISPKIDWTKNDSVSPSAAITYLEQLSMLRKALAVVQATPPVPNDLEKLTYIEANNIEKILEDIDILLTRSAQAWFYSGDLFSGEA